MKKQECSVSQSFYSSISVSLSFFVKFPLFHYTQFANSLFISIDFYPMVLSHLEMNDYIRTEIV